MSIVVRFNPTNVDRAKYDAEHAGAWEKAG